jgi:hypothetical protein
MTRLFISRELENAFGPLDSKIRRRLSEVHTNPRKFWDRDHGIILRWHSEHLTLWQAILKIDPTFPRVGPREDNKGHRLEDWARYPTPKLIEQALLYAAPVQGRPFGRLT